MMKIPLADYLRMTGTSQERFAKLVGITQGAIHQMIKKGRSVDVIKGDDGSIRLEETKMIGKQATA